MTVLFGEFVGTQSPQHVAYSIAILLVSAVVLMYGLFAFAHARLISADVREIERLHREGLLHEGASLEDDYRALAYLIDTIAPAVYMRQEVWVKSYYCVLRTSRAVLRYSDTLQLEMQRLVAHQCGAYREACARLAEIQAIT